MVVKWFVKAVRHWTEMQDYCIAQFGTNIALKSAEKVDAQLQVLMKYPYRGTPEPLLNKERIIYRSVHIHKKIKLIYKVDDKQGVIYVVDFWNTDMLSKNLIQRD